MVPQTIKIIYAALIMGVLMLTGVFCYRKKTPEQ